MRKVSYFLICFFILNYHIQSLAWYKKSSGRAVKAATSSPLLQKSLLIDFLQKRCYKYLGDTFKKKLNCYFLGQDFYKFLDVAIVKQKGISTSAVFVSEFEDLLGDKRVYYFLQDFNSRVERLFYGVGELSLYDLAFEYTQNKQIAIRWLAVLFQDTSESLTHLFWLKQNKGLQKSPLSREIVKELTKALRFLADKNQPGKLLPSTVSLLPEYGEVYQGLLNPLLYHYYVMAYLTQKLYVKGYSVKESFFASFFLNYMYELVGLRMGMKLLLKDPKKIVNVRALSDIYMGYLGALQGLPEGLGIAEPMESLLFRQFMSKDVPSTIKFLLP